MTFFLSSYMELKRLHWETIVLFLIIRFTEFYEIELFAVPAIKEIVRFGLNGASTTVPWIFGRRYIVHTV